MPGGVGGPPGGAFLLPSFEVLMRVKLLLVGGLALLLGSCSGGGSHAPPPLNKELLAGRWKTTADTPFLDGYEFDKDGGAKRIIHDMKQPVTGRYSWTGDRTLHVKYDLTPEVRKAYDAAAQAYKDEVTKRIKAKTLSDRAGPFLIDAVPEKLPDEESFQVSISDKPALLILTGSDGSPQNFERVAD
jgi:hypothetical protein